MALYHCSVKTIGRSGGSSIVNSAAYRSGEKLYDEVRDKTFVYAGKALDVMHKEVMAPENAPEWVEDRGKLWNAVEVAEKRKDSQLAREVEISLPREFSTEQNIALVKEYVQKEFVDRGMIADVCLHYGKDKENPHAHVLLTMRNIGKDGFGKKDVSWNRRELLNQWRESWAELTNKHLSINGYEITVDHRSLKEQGIELIPNNVELPNDAKERLTDQKDRQIAIMRENGEKLRESPEIVFDAITRHKSTFTEKDIARYINSRTADNEQFQEVMSKVKSHEGLVRLTERDGEALYTTKEMLDIERTLFKDARAMIETSNFKVGEIELSDRLNLGQKAELSLEQRAAVEYICQDKDFRAIVGFAGTGKTYMLKEAKRIWESNGYRVKGATLSGIAAQGLEKGSGITSKTVARCLVDWNNGVNVLTSKDILVIDEAGMLGVRDVARIMSEAKKVGAKVVMLGDPQQLQAIEAGAAFRGLAEREGYLEMGDIRRQEAEWQRIATKDLATGKIGEAIRAYETAGKVLAFENKEKAINEMVKSWGKKRNEQETSIMLAFKREDVRELNEQAREYLKAKGEFGEGVKLETINGEREFSKGEQIYFLKNNNELGVKNGTLGIVKSVNENGDVRVSIRDAKGSEAREVMFNIREYEHIDHGYAATIHKSQGITVAKSYALFTKGFNQHLTYVALSRHIKEVIMYWSKDEFKSYSSLVYQLGKEGKKENALDYVGAAKEFIENRGIGGSYKNIVVKVNQLFSEVKQKIGEIKDIAKVAVEGLLSKGEGSKGVILSIEDRREFDKVIQEISTKVGRAVSREFKVGEELHYIGKCKIGEKEYGVMYERENLVKVLPHEQCLDVRKGEVVQVSKGKGGEVIVRLNEEGLWQRRLRDIEQEHGKKVVSEVKEGNRGKHIGEISRGKQSYVVMKQYDKVVLVNSQDCSSELKKGDYMKIEKQINHLVEGLTGEKKYELRGVVDKEMQVKMEQVRAKEVVRSKGIEIGM